MSYTLHGAVRSSAAWRTRIALNLKGVAFKEILHDLSAGEQHTDAYRRINPQRLVPALETPKGGVLHQSQAIIEYLEETFEAPALLPKDAEERARVRALAAIIACDIHPINNLRVRNHVRDAHPDDPQAQRKWMDKWSNAGFDAIEQILATSPFTGKFCHGDQPGYADCFLVPQVGNARSMGDGVEAWPNVERIANACAALPAFEKAHPDTIARSLAR
jgi:maleylacetoacetate isomerase